MCSTISISEIKKILEEMFRLLEEKVGETIFIDEDYYWVLAEDINDKSKIEPSVFLGSLVDEIESLKSIVSGEYYMSTVDIDRIVGVLSSLAIKFDAKKGFVTISIAELKKACGMALYKTENAMGEQLCFKQDYEFYWKIQAYDRYNIYKFEPDMVAGSLSDDIKRLKDAIANNNVSIANLEQISAIFATLSTVFDKREYFFI